MDILPENKLIDYLAVGAGLEGVIHGAVRMANNPPNFVLYYKEVADNPQFLVGNLLVFGGGAMLAYGIDRIIKRYKKE